MDLQDKTRMEDVYKDLTEIIDKIGNVNAFPPLVWVWTWDLALSTLRDFKEDEEFIVNMDEKQMFELFWEQADKNGFSLEYGTEDLYEAVRDWMIDQGVVAYLEEEDEEDE